MIIVYNHGKIIGRHPIRTHQHEVAYINGIECHHTVNSILKPNYTRIRGSKPDAWFPAANLDYYVARPLNKKVYSLGALSLIHKYYWIDKARGDLQKGTDAYYIAVSYEYREPHQRYGLMFDSIGPPDTLKIFRGRELTWQAYVYRLYGLKKKISFRNFTDFLDPTNEQIDQWVQKIRSNPDWLRIVKEKARKKGATLNDVLWDEASWMVEQEKHSL